jgi:hypothetical protein
MSWIGVALNHGQLATDYIARTVAMGDFLFWRFPVHLNQCCVVDVATERFLYRIQVAGETIAGKLHTVSQTTGQIAYESVGPFCVPQSHKPLRDKFRVRVNSYPRPNVPVSENAPSVFGDILLLGVAETPNLIDLEPLTREVHHDLVVIPFTGLADVHQQLDHRVLGNASHANGCPDGIALDKG